MSGPAMEPILMRIDRACGEYMRDTLRPPGAILLGARAYAEAAAEALKAARAFDEWPLPAGLLRYMSPVGAVALYIDGRLQPDDVWACSSVRDWRVS